MINNTYGSDISDSPESSKTFASIYLKWWKRMKDLFIKERSLHIFVKVLWNKSNGGVLYVVHIFLTDRFISFKCNQK